MYTDTKNTEGMRGEENARNYSTKKICHKSIVGQKNTLNIGLIPF